MNREQWLHQAARKLTPLFTRAGLTIPAKLRISCGWASGKGKRGETLGQCWAPVCSGDEHTEVFITPKLDDEMTVLGTLIHELIHAAIGTDKGHGPEFKAAALAVGLEGKMTETGIGADLAAKLAVLIENKLPPYPHARLEPRAKANPDKQGTRMIRVTCPDQECGYSVRTTKKWITVGLPTCPCGEEMAADMPDEGGEGE